MKITRRIFVGLLSLLLPAWTHGAGPSSSDVILTADDNTTALTADDTTTAWTA